MHLRLSRTLRNGHTYEYAQLVQSYRQSNGVPAQKVLGSLGKLSALEVQNLRLALEASRSGKAVVLPTGLVTSRTRANLRYLDVAVMLETWRSWGFDDLLGRVLPTGDAEVRTCDVIASLVIQRAVEPGSKLQATRWFPTTALPELLGVAPGQFNNSRLHRVLGELDEEADERLQDALCERYRARQVVANVLYVDLTNTWFVGQGPKMAEPGQTKEGLWRRKVGIVLACDEQGYPVRWRMVRGREDEARAVFAMLKTAHRHDWIGERPFVCDRALGASGYLQRMDDEGYQYVTALRRGEFSSYGGDLPTDCLDTVAIGQDDAVAQASRAIAPHMTRIGDDLYVRDLGCVERNRVEPQVPRGGEKTVEAMRQVRQMAADLDSGRARNIREAARSLGLAKEYATKLLKLRRLAPDLQDDLLIGGGAGVSLSELRTIAEMPDPVLQRDAYAAAVRQARVRPDGRAARPRGVNQPLVRKAGPLKVRAVLAFNPEAFVEQRRNADKRLARIQAQIRGYAREEDDPAVLAHRIDHLLVSENLLKVFKPESSLGDIPGPRLRLDEAEWRARRRLDGFSILVAHPDIQIEAGDLARLYRAKDVVEKDFQTIKSVIRLRPVCARLDDKVRAHVTLCVLALLLHRTIEKRLDDAGRPGSALMAVETLRTAHLNLLDIPDGPSAYDLTLANQDQAALVEALGLTSLLDSEAVAATLTPR